MAALGDFPPIGPYCVWSDLKGWMCPDHLPAGTLVPQSLGLQFYRTDPNICPDCQAAEPPHQWWCNRAKETT